MSATISVLPVWKKDASPSEWFMEMAAMALASPERFRRIAVVYEEHNNEGSITRHASYKVETNSDVLGLMETAKLELFEYMKGRQE